MEIIISEKCRKCGEKVSGMTEVFFNYNFSICTNCYCERNGKEKLLKRLKEVQHRFEDRDIPEDFYELINYVIRNV